MVNLKIKKQLLITWMIYFELQDKFRNRVSSEPWTGHPRFTHHPRYSEFYWITENRHTPRG